MRLPSQDSFLHIVGVLYCFPLYSFPLYIIHFIPVIICHIIYSIHGFNAPPFPLILQVLSSGVNYVLHYQVGGSTPVNKCTQGASSSSSGSSGSGSSSSSSSTDNVLHIAVEAAVTGWVAG